MTTDSYSRGRQNLAILFAFLISLGSCSSPEGDDFVLTEKSEKIKTGIDFDQLQKKKSLITTIKFNKEWFQGKLSLSAGEMSSMRVDSIKIKNVSLAVTSKDFSKIDISNSSIKNCEIAYLAFRKKPEYGTSEINAHNVKIRNCKELNLTEIGSSLTIDNKVRSVCDENVRKYLYGGEYEKKTVI